MIPRDKSVSLSFSVFTTPFSPTTAFSFSKVTVVAGLSRSTLPSLIALATSGGIASASTFSPTERAVFGLTDFGMTSCIRAASVQNCSSPKVSNRKTCFPSVGTSAEGALAEGEVESGDGGWYWLARAAAVAPVAPGRLRKKGDCQNSE